MEGDREVVRRDIRRGDQVIASGTGCGELGVGPELPGEVHVPGIQGLAVRPLQVGAQVERPGLEISADATVRSITNGARYARCDGTSRGADKDSYRNSSSQ